jgi:hypothetical protein
VAYRTFTEVRSDDHGTFGGRCVVSRRECRGILHNGFQRVIPRLLSRRRSRIDGGGVIPRLLSRRRSRIDGGVGFLLCPASELFGREIVEGTMWVIRVVVASPFSRVPASIIERSEPRRI